MSKINLEMFLKYIKPNNDIESEYCNYNKCKECGGHCCKSLGCYISPDDLTEVTYESITSLLASGCASIDKWECDKPALFLRMRNTNGGEVDYSWGGTCVLWDKDKGCQLDFQHRPKGGRTLTPTDMSSHCLEGFSKYDCKTKWYKYRKLLAKVINRY